MSAAKPPLRPPDRKRNYARDGRPDGGRPGSGLQLCRQPDARPVAGVAIWRPAQPLFFANADAILTETAARIAKTPDGMAVVVSLEESFDLDSTALDALLEFDGLVLSQGKRLQYARVHDRVRDLIALAAPALLKRFSYSVDDAVAAVAAPTTATRSEPGDAR